MLLLRGSQRRLYSSDSKGTPDIILLSFRAEVHLILAAAEY